MNKDPITVHALSPIVQSEDQPSESDAAREDAFILSRGRSVLRAGCHTTDWQTPNARELEDWFLNNAFIYLPTPPMVPAAGAPVISTMDEWDTRPSVSEKFSIANLEPFYSQHTPPPGVLKEGRSRRSSGSFTSRRPPTKRKKVEEEMGSLDELITLPHYIPAPLKSSHPALPHVPHDICPSFVPVPPQNKSSIEALFASIYSRVAWLIPVRGLLPWEAASWATMVLSHISLPGDGYLSASSESDIVWTYSSFRQFWTFLRSCLETPDSVTGPLSLSFCAASPRSDTSGSRGASEASTTSSYLSANRETEITPTDPPSPLPIASASKSRLADIDYVKVYCDAPRAMLVRRVLREWAYEEGGYAGDPTWRDPSKEAVRILEFAKLVLVDERGEGVLIS